MRFDAAVARQFSFDFNQVSDTLNVGLTKGRAAMPLSTNRRGTAGIVAGRPRVVWSGLLVPNEKRSALGDLAFHHARAAARSGTDLVSSVRALLARFGADPVYQLSHQPAPAGCYQWDHVSAPRRPPRQSRTLPRRSPAPATS